MKIWPLTAPKSINIWTVFAWRQVQLQFGRPAKRWLVEAKARVAHDDEHAVLWDWLFQLTKAAVEPKMCMIRWHKQREDWKSTDKWLWTLRNRCADRADAAVRYLQQLYDELHSSQPMPDPPPPIEYRYFREAFAALSSMHRALSQEATLYQTITVDYHRQQNPQTKNDIQNFYGEKLRRRLDGIHSRIANDCIHFLNLFESVDAMVLQRISQSRQAVDLLGTERTVLREKFVAVQQLIRPVRQSFDENPQQYIFNIRDFASVVPISAVDTARRIERMARRQLNTLRGPLLKVAQGWLDIIRQGDRLRNAAEGSPEAAINANLTRTADFIDNMTQIQQQSVSAQHPAPAANATRMLNTPLLQQNQSLPDASMRIQRFNTAPQGQINTWQTLYAEASGYVPYRDPLTGLTRFHRTNIPDESGPTLNPMLAAQGQAQGHNLIGALAPGAGNIPIAGGQVQPQTQDAFSGFMNVINQRAQGSLVVPNVPPAIAGQPMSLDPSLPALNTAGVNVPNANGPVTVRQASAVVALRDLIDERGRQLQANPALAGQVVPSIYNQALQTVAGPNGEALTNNNVPGANNLFGRRASQHSMAFQQLEAVIRQQALGPDPSATLRAIPAQGGGQQAPGGVVPQPNLLYDPVGGNAFQTFPQGGFAAQGSLQNQQPGNFPQGPLPPPVMFQNQGGAWPQGPQQPPPP